MIYRDKSGINLHFKAILVFLFFTPVLIAQVPRDSGMVRYNFDYEFRDGIYASIEMVMANLPIPPARVVSDLDRFDHKFYKEVLSAEDIFMYDDQGVQVYLKSKDVWGYAHKGVIYIQVGNRFHRLILEGNISRFLASSTTWEKLYSSPSPGDTTAYQPTTSVPNNWRRPIYTNTTREGEVYLLDFEMNVMKAYDQEALMELLERDSMLYNEYSDLGVRQRKKKMLEFIQRYNNRHPLYFPVTNNRESL